MTSPLAAVNRLLSLLAQGMIWAWRLLLGPLLGPRCRFLPTCSEYGLQAVRTLGPWRGSWLALRRIARCHPWGASGYDPVPTRDTNATCCPAHARAAQATEHR